MSAEITDDLLEKLLKEARALQGDVEIKEPSTPEEPTIPSHWEGYGWHPENAAETQVKEVIDQLGVRYPVKYAKGGRMYWFAPAGMEYKFRFDNDDQPEYTRGWRWKDAPRETTKKETGNLVWYIANLDELGMEEREILFAQAGDKRYEIELVYFENEFGGDWNVVWRGEPDMESMFILVGTAGDHSLNNGTALDPEDEDDVAFIDILALHPRAKRLLEDHPSPYVPFHPQVRWIEADTEVESVTTPNGEPLNYYRYHRIGNGLPKDRPHLIIAYGPYDAERFIITTNKETEQTNGPDSEWGVREMLRNSTLSLILHESEFDD